MTVATVLLSGEHAEQVQIVVPNPLYYPLPTLLADSPENVARNVQATATPCGSHDLDACDVAYRKLFTRPPDSNANHSG